MAFAVLVGHFENVFPCTDQSLFFAVHWDLLLAFVQRLFVDRTGPARTIGMNNARKTAGFASTSSRKCNLTGLERQLAIRALRREFFNSTHFPNSARYAAARSDFCVLSVDEQAAKWGSYIDEFNFNTNTTGGGFVVVFVLARRLQRLLGGKV